MVIHPKIKNFINCIKESGHDIFNENIKVLNILWALGATATEATVTLHLGFNIALEKAEQFIKDSRLWEPEAIQDVAYQTFLYLNYNPEDPNFSHDENSVKFSLNPPPPKKKDNK